MSRAKGNIAEKEALLFLQERGFELVEQNFYSKFGEIDIIMQKDNIYHFIEVKSAPSYEVAIANITPQKLSRIIKTAYVYMKKNSLNVEYSFDAVIVSDDIEFLENITL